VYSEDRSEAGILDGIRRGRVFLSSGPTVSFRARGSGGAEVALPGDQLSGDGTVDLTVDVERLDEPATLWFVTSGQALPLGELEPGSAHVAREGLVARHWWRLELRNGSASNGDVLALTNPVFATA
jgi:hypothetical protein